jgi:hypothetical protein
VGKLSDVQSGWLGSVGAFGLALLLISGVKKSSTPLPDGPGMIW